jgi:hypothetical protein
VLSRVANQGEPMTPNTEDNKIEPTALRVEPDAHGQAALLLAESTLHMLVEVGILKTKHAITAVQVAAEVKVEVAAITGESLGRMRESLALLAQIQASFEADGANRLR